MEYDTYQFSSHSGDTIRWKCLANVDGKPFYGCGPTEDAAVLDALDKASAESDEARIELGILLGVRGQEMGGRRPLDGA